MRNAYFYFSRALNFSTFKTPSKQDERRARIATTLPVVVNGAGQLFEMRLDSLARQTERPAGLGPVQIDHLLDSLGAEHLHEMFLDAPLQGRDGDQQDRRGWT